MLGVEVPAARVSQILKALEITAQPAGGAGGGGGGGGGAISCIAPAFRPDLTREIDLIEEVARIHGLDKLPVHDKIAVAIAPPQTSERAMGELARVLTGLGYYEAVTFTFVSEKAAKPFVPRDLATISVCDDRRKADPVLRPSALPSLLACRRANQDAGVAGDGGAGGAGIRLYETSAVFAQTPAPAKGARGKEIETRNLALLIDAALPEGGKTFDRKQTAVRAIRGTIEAIVQSLGGAAAASKLAFEADAPPVSAYDPAASGVVKFDGRVLGVFGIISDALTREYGLASPVAAAELGLDALIALYPPRALVSALPQFPSIERDLSLIVAESTPWSAVRGTIDAARTAGELPLMDEFWFVTTYRGQPVAAGKKSVTFRMRFRDPADQRTLRHEEVDPQVASLVDRAKRDLAAEIRM
jgi:phenylalanyl-tRNA synthetase beta chain